MIDLLVIAGPFQRSTLGDRRTFSWPGIGDRRTFFSEWIAVLGFQKPTKPDRFRSYKAYVYSKLSCFKQRGERAPARLLGKKSIRPQDGPQERSATSETTQERTSRKTRAAAMACKVRRLIAGRSPPMAVGSRGQACGARPTIRLGKAANAMLPGTTRRGPAAATPGVTTLAGTRSS